MNSKLFYGTENSETVSYLEFGEINLKQGKKVIWDFRLHEKAYDWLMCARYANDMVTYIDMKEKLGQVSIEELVRLYSDGVHHSNDASGNLSKLCALAVVKQHLKKNSIPSFFELGQTLFGCIEGMEFYQDFLKYMKVDYPYVDMKNMTWYGVDISPFFNRMAILLHERYTVRTMEDMSLLPHQSGVFFAKGITLLYAIRSAQQLIDTLNSGRICVFDYSFSMKGEQETTIGSGKLIKYLDFGSFYHKHCKNNKRMYVRKNKSSYNASINRVFLDCVYGEEDMCRDFVGLDRRVRSELVSKLETESATVLLDINIGENTEWVTLEEFIDAIK